MENSTKKGSSWCWICMSPAAVHVQGTSYVCADHAEGTGGQPYLENGEQID